MNKTVVVYTSQTGLTKKYADWIAEKLDCRSMDIKEWGKQRPLDYRTVIYGGGFYAGSIKGLKKVKEQMKQYPEIKFIVFATGATPAEAKEMTESAMASNFTEEERKNIPAYYFQSGLNYDRMGVSSKMMMKMFSAMMKKKENKTEAEKGMASMLTKSYDFCNKENIRELVECVTNSGES